MQKIISKIKGKVTGVKDNLIAIAVNDAIDRNDDPALIISNLKDMINDNYRISVELLGKNLVVDIKNIKL